MPAFKKRVSNELQWMWWMLTDSREFTITSAEASTLNSNSKVNQPTDVSHPILKIVVVSVLQAGCFFGSLIAYYVADRWGRRVLSLSRKWDFALTNAFSPPYWLHPVSWWSALPSKLRVWRLCMYLLPLGPLNRCWPSAGLNFTSVDLLLDLVWVLQACLPLST